MRALKAATAEQRAAFAAERKQLRKDQVTRNRLSMEEQAQAERERALIAKHSEAKQKKAEMYAAKLAALEALARKLVDKELHKAEYEQKQKQFQAEKQARLARKRDENARKLFVGGVNVDDLKHTCTALTGVLDQARFEQMCTARGDQLLSIFRRFGMHL